MAPPGSVSGGWRAMDDRHGRVPTLGACGNQGLGMMQNRLARRALLSLGLAAAFAGSGWGAPAEVTAPIQALNTGLLAIMRAGKAASFTRRFDMLAPMVARAFDLDAILQAVIGLRWAALAEAEKTALRAEFRWFTIASWVANFDSFNGEEFTLQPEPRPIGDGGLVVDTRMAAPGGTPISLSYVMRQTGADWRAVDILAEGTISRVAVMRSDFRQILAQGGAAALVVRLREKNAALGAGKTE